jgi:hypothetical protein
LCLFYNTSGIKAARQLYYAEKIVTFGKWILKCIRSVKFEILIQSFDECYTNSFFFLITFLFWSIYIVSEKFKTRVCALHDTSIIMIWKQTNKQTNKQTKTPKNEKKSRIHVLKEAFDNRIHHESMNVKLFHYFITYASFDF